MYCFKLYICIGVKCVCTCVCVYVCVSALTHARVSACVWVGGVCGCACTLERAGGRERRAGVDVSAGGR